MSAPGATPVELARVRETAVFTRELEHHAALEEAGADFTPLLGFGQSPS